MGDSSTGKVLATVKPPAHFTFAGVTGAADDRTFVLDATRYRTRQPNQEPHAHAHLVPAPHRARAPRTRPADQAADQRPVRASAQVDGLALSPDAGTLAILSQPAE